MATIRTAYQDVATGQLTGSEMDPNSRVGYKAIFGNAVAKSSSFKGTSATNKVASWNQDFILSGEGTMTAAAHSGGGTKLTAESSDSAIGAIVKPRTGGRFASTKWDTSDEVHFSTLVKTGSGTITTTAIQAGLMLTGNMNLTTDANQVKFFYNAADTNWQVAISVGGTDTAYDTGVTAAASTLYSLALKIQSDRTVKAYINGVAVATTSALTATTDLLPIVAVAADGSAADPFVFLYHITCTKNAT